MNFITSKISLGLFSLITLIAINSFVTTVSAQIPIPKGSPRCTSTADTIYFVDSGRSVTEVHPGSNGGNGYQLNIIGKNVDKFEVIQENYMTSVSVIPNYTNSTSAKWSVFFAPNMGQVISSIRMKSKCGSTEIKTYQLTESVTLLDQ
jgi:hypothetical protein